MGTGVVDCNGPLAAGVAGENAGAPEVELLLCAKPAGPPEPGVGLYWAWEGVTGLPDVLILAGS